MVVTIMIKWSPLEILPDAQDVAKVLWPRLYGWPNFSYSNWMLGTREGIDLLMNDHDF